MGTELPDGWPDIIENELWYRVGVDLFTCNEPEPRCKTYYGSGFCCVDGLNLNRWIQKDRQCTYVPLCPLIPISIQRLVSISQPFGDLFSCMGE